MLLFEQTKEKFGYTVDSLSKSSRKKIIFQCEYCNKIFDRSIKNYNLSRKVLAKDACNKCKYKKREEMEILKTGFKNSAQRQEVKETIKESNRKKFGVDYFVQTQEFKDKAKATNLDKYGVEIAIQNPEILKRKEDTMKKRYGVVNPSQSKEIRERVEETCLEKYGNKHFLGSDVGREVIIEKVQEKYGVGNVFQDEEIKQKIKQTHLENLGVENPTQSKKVQEKIKQTCLRVYGHERAAQSNVVKEKTKKTNLDKYGYITPLQHPDIKAKIKQKSIDNGHIYINDDKTMTDWAKSKGITYSGMRSRVQRYGFDIAVRMEKHVSGLESKFIKLLDSLNIKYTHQFGVENRIADFLLNDYNILIEIDGLYWHSDLCLEDKYYHKNKRQLYIDNGYKPLFFREDELKNSEDIIKSIILNKCGLSKRIYGRECIIAEIDKKLANEFMDQNHLMGHGRGFAYGIYHNGDLISVMQFCRKNKDNFEVSRFCHKIGYTVVGGFSKLLRYIERQMTLSSVYTFIDLRYGSGEYLTNLGFTEEKCGLSFRWTSGLVTHHRMKFPGNLGYNRGFAKIWDCGQKKYRKVYNNIETTPF